MSASTFRELHADGTFILPNPWDVGSAKLLEAAGFTALATTSSGLAASLGRRDQSVTRDELVAHVASLAGAVEVPVNVDAERCYSVGSDGIAETIELLAEAGAAGISIEDYDPQAGVIEPAEAAIERVVAAVEACRPHGIVLTARAENYLYGRPDLGDTLARLDAFREAGADCLYAPGVHLAHEIAEIVALGAPVNVLALPSCPRVPELTRLGVRRISTGGALAFHAYAGLMRAVDELQSSGTYGYYSEMLTATQRSAFD